MIPFLDNAVPVPDAIAAVRTALRGGLDPDADPARSVVPVEHGQLLLMPAQWGGYAGVKLVSVAPGNPDRGRPRIQGTYLLLDGETLTPLVLLDDIALTSVRTAAVRRLTDLASVVRGAPVDRHRPRLFKSVGMAWEDPVIAVRTWEKGNMSL